MGHISSPALSSKKKYFFYKLFSFWWLSLGLTEKVLNPKGL